MDLAGWSSSISLSTSTALITICSRSTAFTLTFRPLSSPLSIYISFQLRFRLFVPLFTSTTSLLFALRFFFLFFTPANATAPPSPASPGLERPGYSHTAATRRLGDRDSPHSKQQSRSHSPVRDAAKSSSPLKRTSSIEMFEQVPLVRLVPTDLVGRNRAEIQAVNNRRADQPANKLLVSRYRRDHEALTQDFRDP